MARPSPAVTAVIRAFTDVPGGAPPDPGPAAPRGDRAPEPAASAARAGAARPLALALVAGTVLMGIGAAPHPDLSGDAAADLALIAATPYWRAIHLTMLLGSALVIVGIWTRLALRRDGPEGRTSAAPLLAALAVLTVGITLNALNIAFMAGAGTRMAELHAAGDAAVARIFDATHPVSQMTARFGNLLVAVGAAALGLAERADATRPRALAWLAWGAAAGGLVGVVLAHESSPFALAAVTLLAAWQLATAWLALRARQAPDGGA